MTEYPAIYEFTPMGLVAFKRIFEGDLSESAINPVDPQFALPVRTAVQN
jgi:hypothetical protein